MNELVKWRCISYAATSRVTHRLHDIWLHRPSHVAPLLQFGLMAFPLQWVWLNFQKMQGLSLYDLLPHLTKTQRYYLSGRLQTIVKQWEKQNFIHGDLSPRNILIEPSTQQIWFIDWILDLQSFEATPKYADKKVFKGIRDFSTDTFAIEKIIREILSPSYKFYAKILSNLT